MLEDVVALLRCPGGEPTLRLDDRTLVCDAGHRFDVARQGYVNLLRGPAPAGVDTAAMVAARAKLLAAGHQDPLTDAVTDAIQASPRGTVTAPIVDLGAGTAYHLAGMLDATGAPAGVAVDVSKYAARRAARAHPKVGAIVADVWSTLPIRSGVAALVTAVFAPRDVHEAARVLAPDGRFVVVTPAEEHLAPLVDRLGLLRVAPGKADELDAQVADLFTPIRRTTTRWVRELGHDDVRAVVAMGPSAWHTDAAELDARLLAVPDPVPVTFAVTVSVFARRPLR